MADTPLLTIEDVHAGYPGKEHVLEGVSLAINKGEVAGLASLDDGGGKTTLVKVLAGLLVPSAGRVLFDGDDVYSMGFSADQRFRARVSVVLEGGALLVNRSIWDNIALPLRYHGDRRGRELRVSVERLLAQCGYNEGLHAFPWQISERSRRLAAFARALARNPEFVVVDRFFEGLEMPDWRRLFELVMELNQNEGVTWLLVSELDPGIFQVAERVAILEHGRVLGFDFRKQLYANRRILAAFEAAELRASQRLRRLGDSDRILIVESSTEFDALASGGGVSESDLAIATPTMRANPVDDVNATLNVQQSAKADPYTQDPTDAGWSSESTESSEASAEAASDVADAASDAELGQAEAGEGTVEVSTTDSSEASEVEDALAAETLRARFDPPSKVHLSKPETTQRPRTPVVLQAPVDAAQDAAEPDTADAEKTITLDRPNLAPPSEKES